MGVLVRAVPWKLVNEKFISTMVVGFFSSTIIVINNENHDRYYKNYWIYYRHCFINKVFDCISVDTTRSLIFYWGNNDESLIHKI